MRVKSKVSVFKRTLSWLLSVVMIFGMLVVSNVSLTVSAYSYNASAAVDYARQYWNNYNSAYTNYNSVGGDCANFVSQCLYAGGLEQDDRWYNGSAAWISCSSQIAYFRDMGFTVIDYAQASDIQIGNPVYYYNGNSMAHTAICVGYSSDGTPLVAAHNKNHWEYEWTLGGANWWGGSTRRVTILMPGHNNFPGAEDTSYAVPVSLKAKQHDNTYDDNGNIEWNRWIDEGDDCYIEKVYTNGFCRVEYPAGNERRWAYAKTSLFDIPIFDPPRYNSISVSKSEYEITDTVSIFVDSPNATSFTVGIDKDGVGRVVTENCGNTYNVSASILGQGTYSAYMTIRNQYGWIDTSRVVFTIKNSYPSKPTIGAYVGTNFAPTTFGWNATENTTHYALKIWKGTCWEGPSYKEFLVYDTSYVVDLPAGYYEAYVDSLNEYGWTCSDVIKFTVEYGNPYDSGDDFYANIIRNDDWGHLADVDGNVIINNNGSKLWHFTKTSDGGYFIQNVATGKYLDVSNASDENGCNIQTCNYNGSAAQIWYRYGRWGEYLKPKCTANRIMDIDRASGNAQIWDLEYNDNQKLAIWIYDKFNISYDMNGGVGNISNQVKVDCYDTTISSIIPTRTGYNFVGWSKNKNAITAEYPSGATFKENENTTLYAIWKLDYNLQPTSKDEFNGHTYEYYNQAFTWDEAYKFCEKKGGHLVTINSQEENDFLVELTKNRSANLWAGGKTTDNEKWFWITGEPFDYQNWNVGEPNNLENIQDTLQIYTSGKWDDVSTGAYTCQFVCEYDDKIDASKYTPVYKENYNGHEYWFFENDVDWQTAKKICEAKGGYLVVINNAEENQKVMSGIQKTSKKEAWIGITDIKDNVWKDVKGNSLTYTNWASGEPSNSSDIEDYGNLFEDGTWNDLMGYGYIYRSIGFVCEFDDLCTGSGHKYVEKIVAPTCTAKGYTLHTCKNCNDSYKDTYTNATGHDFGEWIVITVPTSTNVGEEQRICSICGPVSFGMECSCQ